MNNKLIELRLHYWSATPDLREVKIRYDEETYLTVFMNAKKMRFQAQQFVDMAKYLLISALEIEVGPENVSQYLNDTPQFTLEQRNWIDQKIEEWYLKWAKHIVKEGVDHRLKFAKEDIKAILINPELISIIGQYK